MATEHKTSAAQLAANRRNAQHSTGARTPEGKARSAANAISFGLFAANDFVRPGEATEYAAFTEAWHKQLAAAEPAEEATALEITRAAWRLRRCALTEAALVDPAADRQLDPMVDPETAPLQTAIDRAHTSAHRKMLRSMAELRRLQTERHFRQTSLSLNAGETPELGLTSTRDLSKSFALDASRQLRQRRLEELATVEDIIDATLPPRASETPAKTPRPADPFNALRPAAVVHKAENWLRSAEPASVARNAHCPCGSGDKYKRCCGKNAPPVLNTIRRAA
jgi:hypothetical protein